MRVTFSEHFSAQQRVGSWATLSLDGAGFFDIFKLLKSQRIVPAVILFGPLRSIRAHCVECCGGSFAEVRACASQGCPLWTYRAGHRPRGDEAATVADVPSHPAEQALSQAELVRDWTATKAIRRRCLDCSGHNSAEVRRCQLTACGLHGWRMNSGTRHKPLTDEERERLVAFRIKIREEAA